MSTRFSDHRAFWREFRQTFHTTGAILPSGRQLSRALASQVRSDAKSQRILEVGPGTGVVTSEILKRLGPDDTLDLVELNERFADILRRRFAESPEWKQAASRVRILQMSVEKLPLEEKYDRIISGLPLNNFDCETVKQVFEHFHGLAAEQCVLSFFEYVAIRKLKAVISSRTENARLSGIEKIMSNELADWEFKRDLVLTNIPPAWVHHLRLASPIQDNEECPAVQPAVC